MENYKPYPSDVSDEEWAFVAPCLTLFPLDAGQRKHSLRKVFNAVRYVVRCGCPWRMLPNDLPPSWSLVYQQVQRWLAAGCFEERGSAQRHAGKNNAILAARHQVYLRARERNPARWSGSTRNWSPISAVTLNPERDVVVRSQLQAGNKPRLTV